MGSSVREENVNITLDAILGSEAPDDVKAFWYPLVETMVSSLKRSELLNLDADGANNIYNSNWTKVLSADIQRRVNEYYNLLKKFSQYISIDEFGEGLDELLYVASLNGSFSKSRVAKAMAHTAAEYETFDSLIQSTLSNLINGFENFTSDIDVPEKLIFNRSEYSKVVGFANKLIDLGKFNSDHYLRLGDLFLKKGLINEALKVYEKVIKREPKNLRAWEGKVWTLRTLENLHQKDGDDYGLALKNYVELVTGTKKENIYMVLHAIGPSTSQTIDKILSELEGM